MSSQTFSVTATGATGTVAVDPGDFSFNLDFATGSFVGSATLQRSDDNGTTWYNAARDTAGTAATYTTDTGWMKASEPFRKGALYRFNVTRTSGTLSARIGQ